MSIQKSENNAVENPDRQTNIMFFIFSMIAALFAIYVLGVDFGIF
jgi:hypothetical protein